jgi:hypothetical protein
MINELRVDVYLIGAIRTMTFPDKLALLTVPKEAHDTSSDFILIPSRYYQDVLGKWDDAPLQPRFVLGSKRATGHDPENIR